MQADTIIRNSFFLKKDRIIPVRHALRLAAALRRAGKHHELRCHSREGHIWPPVAFRENWKLTLDVFKRLQKDAGPFSTRR